LAKIIDHPTEYTLGTGHVKFFYDNGLYLQERFDSIVAELEKRGFNLNYCEYREHPEGLNNNWTPSTQDIEINVSRLLSKFDEGQKHKYYGQPLTKDEFLAKISYTTI
jgi:deoxyribonuclease (pyrimidine dimer)